MGSLQLTCPFCCDESFSSRLSLKYHILSMIDNIFCPVCSCRLDNILELTEHLNTECKDEAPQVAVSDNKEQEEAIGDILNTPLTTEKDKAVSDTGVNEDTLRDLEKAIDNDIELETPSFICEMCNMQFESIQDHLQEFHEGEDVILETNDEELIKSGEIKIESDAETEEFILEIPKHDDTTYQDNVVNEVDFIDNEGRAFTRKVVKIDKSWINKQPSSPVTEKYIVENGKVRKIEDDEEIDIKDDILEIHRCSHCYLQFPNLDHYLKHMCDPKKTKNKFRCGYCTTVFQDYHTLLTHLKSHLVIDEDGTVKRIVTVGPQTCNICQTMFPTFKSLRLHQRMHEPVKEKKPEAPVKYSISGNDDDQNEIVRDMFICSICNNTYDKEYEEVHMKSHSNEENYICSICNRKFFTKENLEMHANAHSTTKKFTCSYCKKKFTTYELLQEHTATQCQEREYECQYCGRRFSRPHEKVKHERIHTGEKPHVCKICGKAFRVSYCLTLHMRTHSGTRPYRCEHCDKRFKSHSVYTHHLLTHSDVRAYKCPFCPKAFKTAVQLAGHKNSHIKPFNCTVCNRPFASLYAVRSHMETHKKENNLKYVCVFCGATYARAFALRDHMNEHIKNDDGNINEMLLTQFVKDKEVPLQVCEDDPMELEENL